MLVERVFGKVRVALQHVHHNRPPCNNVALLCLLVKLSEGPDDIGAQPAAVSNKSLECVDDLRNQCAFRLLSTVPSFLTFIVVHAQQDADIRVG